MQLINSLQTLVNVQIESNICLLFPLVINQKYKVYKFHWKDRTWTKHKYVSNHTQTVHRNPFMLKCIHPTSERNTKSITMYHCFQTNPRHRMLRAFYTKKISYSFVSYLLSKETFYTRRRRLSGWRRNENHEDAWAQLRYRAMRIIEATAFWCRGSPGQHKSSHFVAL